MRREGHAPAPHHTQQPSMHALHRPLQCGTKEWCSQPVKSWGWESQNRAICREVTAMAEAGAVAVFAGGAVARVGVEPSPASAPACSLPNRTSTALRPLVGGRRCSYKHMRERVGLAAAGRNRQQRAACTGSTQAVRLSLHSALHWRAEQAGRPGLRTVKPTGGAGTARDERSTA